MKTGSLLDTGVTRAPGKLHGHTLQMSQQGSVADAEFSCVPAESDLVFPGSEACNETGHTTTEHIPVFPSESGLSRGYSGMHSRKRSKMAAAFSRPYCPRM